MYAGVVILAFLMIFAGNRVTTKGHQIFGKFSTAPVERVKVDLLLGSQTVELGVGREKHIFFEAEVISGENKGQRILARQINDTMYSVPIKDVEKGDRVMICYTPYGESENIWIFQEYDRSGPLMGVLALFIALLMIFGGKKGLPTLLSLVLTCGSIFYFFVPAILSGKNIYGTTIVVCIFIIAVTLILVNGFNFKSASAAAGCLGGLMVAGILFLISDHFLRLTGMIDEETAYLTMLDVPIDLKAIIFAAVLIGVLGGVLDVGVSIAASLHEIYPQGGGEYKMSDIVRSGMNIGKDIICTMTNTLILVYIGSSLSITLLLTVYSNSFFELINREMITVEILQALLGSIGLLFTIPITTAVYAFGVAKSGRAKEDTANPDNMETEQSEPIPFKINSMPDDMKID